MLAALTLAFALVPAALAFLTFRSARERDQRLFESAAQVLGEQLQLSTYRAVSFLNIMRNQWRPVSNPDNPPDTALPPAGWEKRQPHLLAVAFVSREPSGSFPVRWREGRGGTVNRGDDLQLDDLLRPSLQHAAELGGPLPCSAQLSPARLAVVVPVPDRANLQIVRGFIIGWLDVQGMCTDASLPLVGGDILRASAGDQAPPNAVRLSISGEGEVKWLAAVTRGGAFDRAYGAPTPWLGFVALGLSVAPLGVLVMLASRAGKLRAALEAEKEVGRLKNQFVSSVSHEFRTPLSVILSGADLLDAHGENISAERRAELLSQIRSATERMNDMVGQVLLLGRMDAGARPLHRTPVRVEPLLRSIAAEMESAYPNRCRVQVEADPGGSIMTDESLLRCVLSNAASNAVKYSHPGGEVRLAASVSSAAVRFEIRDQGCGIPEADQSRLGEPFHRGANTAEVPGSGLGLAILKRSVDLLGGEWSITSRAGEGTTVAVVFGGDTTPHPHT
jgi:signal transduction histidine kinase